MINLIYLMKNVSYRTQRMEPIGTPGKQGAYGSSYDIREYECFSYSTPNLRGC